MRTHTAFYRWKVVIAALRKKRSGSVARIPISRIAHPLDARMTQTVAAPIGQRADYKLVLDSETLLYVREFEHHYEAWLCSVNDVSAPTPQLESRPTSAPRPESAAASDAQSVPVRAARSNAFLTIARDAPEITFLCITAAGALLGRALGGKKGAVKGAVLGGCAGFATVAIANAKDAPETAQMSKDLFQCFMNSVGKQQATRRPSTEKAPSRDLPPGKARGRASSKRRK